MGGRKYRCADGDVLLWAVPVQWGSCQERLAATEASLKAAEAGYGHLLNFHCVVCFLESSSSCMGVTGTERRADPRCGSLCFRGEAASTGHRPDQPRFI